MSLKSTFAVVALVLPCIVRGQEIPSYSQIEANRNALLEWQRTEAPEMEFFAQSTSDNGEVETAVAVVIEGIDIEEASVALRGPGAWCEVMFLHLNIKSCVNGENENGQWMRLYMGRKFYQDPRNVEQIEMRFSSGTTDDGVRWVTLTADEGPFNTSDYRLVLSAIEAENGTYAQIGSSQKAGRAASWAIKLYYATLARGKIGFSVVGADREGDPEYSTGDEAMLERNVVRYLIAIRAYMQTYTMSGIEGMRERAAMWFDATEEYAAQLHEVDREDYLRNKDREYLHQMELQSEISGQ